MTEKAVMQCLVDVVAAIRNDRTIPQESKERIETIVREFLSRPLESDRHARYR